jgi:hypothetical protein
MDLQVTLPIQMCCMSVTQAANELPLALSTSSPRYSFPLPEWLQPSTDLMACFQ